MFAASAWGNSQRSPSLPMLQFLFVGKCWKTRGVFDDVCCLFVLLLCGIFSLMPTAKVRFSVTRNRIFSSLLSFCCAWSVDVTVEMLFHSPCFFQHQYSNSLQTKPLYSINYMLTFLINYLISQSVRFVHQ